MRLCIFFFFLCAVSSSASDKKQTLMDSFNRVQDFAIYEARRIESLNIHSDFTPFIQEKMLNAKTALTELLALEKSQIAERNPHHALFALEESDSEGIKKDLLDQFSQNYITALALVNAEMAKKRNAVMTPNQKSRLAYFWRLFGIPNAVAIIAGWMMFGEPMTGVTMALILNIFLLPDAAATAESGPGVIPFIRYLREFFRFSKNRMFRKNAISRTLQSEFSEIGLLLAESNEGHEFLGFLQTANQTLCPKLLTEKLPEVKLLGE